MDGTQLLCQLKATMQKLLNLANSAPALTSDLLSIATELEEIINLKTTFDSKIAYLVSQANSTELSGTNKPDLFLAAALNISVGEAKNRLQSGKYDHCPLSPELQAQREEIRTVALSPEVQRLINLELKTLDPNAEIGAVELRLLAIKEATWRNQKDLRAWMRGRVREANMKVHKDLLCSTRSRYLRIGQQRADGSVPFRGVLSAPQHAVMVTALSAEMKRINDSKSSYEQRLVDALTSVAAHKVKDKQNSGAIASLLISVTTDEIAELKPESTFVTNTGTVLNVLEVAALHGANHDAFAVHDLDNPDSLNVGRCKRLANVWQRIALFATEIVCSHPGCDRAAVWCQAHHIEAWGLGGLTDLANLTQLCRTHHADNDDSKKNSSRGHADRQTTGEKRAGYVAPGAHTVVVNNSTLAQSRPLNRIRIARNLPLLE